jgi:medium-chain acyl-[acyl-carrier-protein] hydrolase
MTGPGIDAWFPFGTAADCGARLVCLPHAGAGASVFLPWRRAAAPEVGVCPVQLPGRETRLGDPVYHRVTDLVTDLLPVLLPLADRPMALFGHSMGALAAFELTRAMRAAGLPMPTRLLVSGRPAPHLADRHPVLHRLPADQLVDALRDLGGTPDEVLGDPALMSRLLPFLRADFELNENYRYVDEPPLAIPLTVYGGTADPRASVAELADWRAMTTGPFGMRTVPGGHFAVFAQVTAVLAPVEGGL